MTDLFSLEQQTAVKRRKVTPESSVLAEVLRALQGSEKVAWARRMNSGGAMVGDRFIRFGFKGCSDILGQLKDGRFLAVECKSKRGRLEPEQEQFLSLVQQAGGVAIVARDCNDVLKGLSDD